MVKNLVCILALSVMIPASIAAQDAVTFRLEELSKPDGPLPTISYKDQLENLVLSDAGIERYEVENGNTDYPYGIIAHNDAPADIIAISDSNPFFYGMYRAYAEHRPFVLSPDMIWLLISQGFARHVNANPEAMRDLLVDFEGKTSLVVTSNDITLGSASDKWEKIFPEFEKQITRHTKGGIAGILSADFSTTTPVEKIASQITLMEAMEQYFEYIHIRIVCGIPEVTLLGTTQDWLLLLEKTKHLAAYDLQWWTDELVPVLEEFVKASQGDVDTGFWMNMFKCHTPEEYGARRVVDGWIVKFYPYDGMGRRNDLKSVKMTENSIAKEIVKVDMKHIELGTDGGSVETELELWAGFFGLEQDARTYALTPKIGWMIRRKGTDNSIMQQRLENGKDDNFGINIRVGEVPEAILRLGKVKNLRISFTGDIIIPDAMADMEIGRLTLSGNITEQEIERIKSMFPGIPIRINNTVVQTGEYLF